MTRAPAERSPFSLRAARLSSGGLTEVFILAHTRAAVDLSIGTPRYPAPSAEMFEEAARAMAAGRNQYEHPAGDIVLRQRIAEAMTAPTDPDDEITITAGATEALYVALLASVDPGDEVILLDPGFDHFFAAVDLVGAIPRFVSLHAPEWRWDSADLAAAFSPRTRAIVLNTPCNPTGRVLTRAELEEIAELCERWNVTVICDEVYRDFVYDGRRHLSVADLPSLAERAVVVGSLSKSHAISGWRLGFLRASRERTEVFRHVHALITLGAAVPLQVAAGAAAKSINLEETVREMAVRRDLAQGIFEWLGATFAPVEGGIFLFADVSSLTGGRLGGMPFIHDLLDRTGVLLAPGTAFFSTPAAGERYVRVAFNRPTEILHVADQRLRAYRLETRGE